MLAVDLSITMASFRIHASSSRCMRDYLICIGVGPMLGLTVGCYAGLAGLQGDGAADTVGPASSGDAPGSDAADDAGEPDPEGSDSSESDPEGSDSAGVLSCDEPSVGLSPLRRLSRRQYVNSVRDLLDVELDASILPEDEHSDAIGPFASNVIAPVSAVGVRDYMDAAEAVVGLVMASEPSPLSTPGTLLPCDPAAVDEQQCASEFIAAFGRRVFRRPLTAEEADEYEQIFTAASSEYGFADGIGLVIETMLQAPQFLYLVEFGGSDDEPVIALTNHEVATRLSYFLWATTPDEALLTAADEGLLVSSAELRAQAERMLESERARESIASFHAQWLGVKDIDRTSKGPEIYPEFDTALAGMMADETSRFVDYVVRSGDARLTTLLTATFSFVEPRLAELYGIDTSTMGEDGRVEFPAGTRAGLLTQASFLAMHAHPNQGSLVKRGVVIRENVLCNALDPPPNDVDTTPPALDPDIPTRERFDQHRDSPSCNGCHALIDPIGYGLLSYDGIGRRMTSDGGMPIDDSGNVAGIGTFVGPAELAQLLADSTQVRNCVVDQWLTFAVGQPLGEADACTVDAVRHAFAASDGNVRQLLLDIVTADSFRYRRPAAK